MTRQLLPPVEARMRELFETVTNDSDAAMDAAALARAAADCDVLVATVTDRIDAEVLAAGAGRLRLVANFGAGVDHIDLHAAREHGILVTNTPGVFTDDTADMTMALILSVPRRFAEGETLIREGLWRGWGPNVMLGHRIGGKQLGIVGMGRIGQAVAQRARAFGLSIVYHSRRQLPETVEQELDARFEPDLDALVAGSDILTLHCPHSIETHGLIDARRIGLMRPDAYLINTARGELVDEEALIAALADRRIGGAGLDVYQHEPAVDPRLLSLQNVVLLPHLGSATFEGRRASGERVIANIRIWADGHRPPDQVFEGWA